jgi:hypothetical protein
MSSNTAPGDDRPATPGYQTQDRHLVLRGGELDGRRWVGVIAVGGRVAVGPGPWSTAQVYVVTDDEVVDGEGNRESVAVPAFPVTTDPP